MTRRPSGVPERARRNLAPTRSDWAGTSTCWRTDLVAGLTVAVVALPLALGFGVASGLGAQAGLATAVVAGALAAVFGGSSVQVSGPTGAMTVVLIPIAASHGADGVLTVGLLAGVVLIALAGLRAGRLLRCIPVPVVEGFTVGIALVIGLQQLPAALGTHSEAHPDAVSAAFHAVAAFADEPGPSGVIALLVAAAVLLAARRRPALPAAILAVAVATLVASVAGLHVTRVGSLPAGLPAPSLAFFDLAALPHLIAPAVTVALLAAVESLLSASVAEAGSDGRGFDPDRELFGQGIANLAAPLVGGVPATGAIARTAVNVRAGGRTRLAALSHAVVLAGVVWTAAPLAEKIPLSALAGVLIATAIRMVDHEGVLSILRARRTDAAVMVVTVAATVALDLVRAVLIGIFVAAVMAGRDVARHRRRAEDPARPAEQVADEQPAPSTGRPAVVRLEGPVVFTVTNRSLRPVTEVDGHDAVVVRMCGISAIDASGARALAEAIGRLEHRGVAVFLSGLRAEHRRVLDTQDALGAAERSGRVFDTAPAAIRAAQAHISPT